MIKFILKLLQNKIYTQEPYEIKKMQDWLWKSFKEEGFKNYYTMRKKYLWTAIVLEDDNMKRAKLKGRYEELLMMKNNMMTEADRRKKDKK